MGLHENPLDLAVSRAKAAPLPEVPSFSDKRVRLLVSICRELQKMTGANPFYLPTRKLGEVLEIHWTRVAKWLRALEVLGIIRLAPGEVRSAAVLGARDIITDPLPPQGTRCPRKRMVRRRSFGIFSLTLRTRRKPAKKKTSKFRDGVLARLRVRGTVGKRSR